jgi:hypothetical protein
MKLMTRLACVAALALVVGCGDDGGGGNGDGDGGTGDGGTGDGGFQFGSSECTDGQDNDGDGVTDGFDPECTGAADNDEGSFATDIPGDNIDPKFQDCFFDGNSGAGNDGCRYHSCCLLDDPNTPEIECPDDISGQYDPADDCEVVQQCIDVCAPLTPAGCDCFGCCTICDDATCVDIYINPAVAPDCDQDTLGDADACPRCTKSTDCAGGDCSVVEDCTVCPGEELPEECNGEYECPGGATSCPDGTCADGLFCSNGCCINIIE